jgi:uncharacterized membrane protein (DUF2068 family)
MASRGPESQNVLYLIAAFKIFKGLLLLAIGFGALELLNREIAAELYTWANSFLLDPGNHFVQRLLVRLSILNDAKLKQLGAATFFYAGLLLTEGTGLALRKRWAQYFTLITTGSLVPLEIYEIIRRATPVRGVVLVLNIAVVVYLVWDLCRNRG